LTIGDEVKYEFQQAEKYKGRVVVSKAKVSQAHALKRAITIGILAPEIE
jgi:hypothetical protein